MSISLNRGEQIYISKVATLLGIEELTKIKISFNWKNIDNTKIKILSWASTLTKEELLADNLADSLTNPKLKATTNYIGYNDNECENTQLINIDLSKISSEYKAITVGLIFYNNKIDESLDILDSINLKIFDLFSNSELCNYVNNLKLESKSNFITTLFGIFVRTPNGWEFNAIDRTIRFNTNGKESMIWQYL